MGTVLKERTDAQDEIPIYPDHNLSFKTVDCKARDIAKESAMTWLRNSLEANFKPVADGFVFRTPSPWLLGPGEHYLVTEAQKAEILGSMSTLRRVLSFVLLSLLLWGAAAAGATLAFTGMTFSVAILIIKAATAASLALAVIIDLRLKLRRLKRTLAGQPRTDEQGRVAPITPSSS
jgi:hypothetical protein